MAQVQDTVRNPTPNYWSRKIAAKRVVGWRFNSRKSDLSRTALIFTTHRPEMCTSRQGLGHLVPWRARDCPWVTMPRHLNVNATEIHQQVMDVTQSIGSTVCSHDHGSDFQKQRSAHHYLGPAQQNMDRQSEHLRAFRYDVICCDAMPACHSNWHATMLVLLAYESYVPFDCGALHAKEIESSEVDIMIGRSGAPGDFVNCRSHYHTKINSKEYPLNPRRCASKSAVRSGAKLMPLQTVTLAVRPLNTAISRRIVPGTTMHV